jgi:hypothetical protein
MRNKLNHLKKNTLHILSSKNLFEFLIFFFHTQTELNLYVNLKFVKLKCSVTEKAMVTIVK